MSENHGSQWQKLQGPYEAKTLAEERGRDLYVQKCRSCHGNNGVGENYSLETLSNKNFARAPALDDSEHAWNHSGAILENIILEGSSRISRMTGWKDADVSCGDAHDLIAYIKSLRTRRELDCQGPNHMQCMQ